MRDNALTRRPKQRTPAIPCNFFSLPLTIRNRIYETVIRTSAKAELADIYTALLLTSRQTHEEFYLARNYFEKFRFKCCLGRGLQDRENTRFYSWDYHRTPWGGPIDHVVTPAFVAPLRTCFVRCTIEELGDFERRSETGAETFKDCVRMVWRTFKDCKYMRDLKVEFHHFIFVGKSGRAAPDNRQIQERVKLLHELPGIQSIKIVLSGETLLWQKNRKGSKRGKRGVDPVWESIDAHGDSIDGSSVAASSHGWERVDVRTAEQHCSTAGRNWLPKGYGLRRGIT